MAGDRGRPRTVLRGPRGAHPLGNFSVNHQTRVKISRDRIDLLYILDQAEIPTFQERKLSGRETLRRKTQEVRENLRLIVNGAGDLHVGTGRIAFPRGQGGLQTTRVELPHHPSCARSPAGGGARPHVPRARRLGRHRRRAGRGTAVRTSVSSADPTNRLATYRGITLQDVTDQRVGRFAVGAGKGNPRRAAGAGERSPPPAPQPRRCRGAHERGRARRRCSRTRAPAKACSS